MPLRRIDWCLVVILLAALAFRLYRIDAPYVDAHSWRQVTNADIARNWTEGPIQFARPLVSWGGPDGRVGMEFPLLHLLTALVWRIVGVNDAAGRLVSVAFSVGTVWLLYLLGARLFGRPTGRAAAALIAVSPSVVYFGRTLLSDTPMLFFSVAAVLGYVGYAQTGDWRRALGGSVALALAGLVKIPAILILGPIVWTGLLMHGIRIYRDPWYVSALIAAMGAIGVWYWHADLTYQATGLTQAIFRPSGTYPADIAAWSGRFFTVSHWTRADLLTLDSVEVLWTRYLHLHLTPVGLMLTVAGFLFAWRPYKWRSVVDVWTLAAFSLVGVSLAGQLPHEFHQLPTLPPLALYFGRAAAPLFDGARWAARLPRAHMPATLAAGGLGLLAAVYLFADSGVIRNLYRPDLMNTPLIDAGRAIEQATPPGALIVTMEYGQYGTNSPMLLYYSHRRGWSFDGTSLTPSVIAYLEQRRHACYFATSDWGILGGHEDVLAYLRTKREVPLPYTSWQYKLYDLGCPVSQ